jgi:hypothetical protein
LLSSLILDATGKEKDAGAVSTSTRVSTVTNNTHPGNMAMLYPYAITADADEENQQNDKVKDEGIPLVESSFAACNNVAFNDTAASPTPSPTPPVRAQMQPRQTEPGVVRVPGIDGDDSVTNATVASNRTDPNNPVSAELVDEDEERRRIQEMVDCEVAAQRERERMDQEEDIPEAEIVEEKYCSTRVKILSVFAVIFMVIVAIVLGTVLPQVIQTDKPTEAPTPSPQEVLNDLEVLLSSVSFDNGTALQTQSTPQNNALIWLANNTNLNS